MDPLNNGTPNATASASPAPAAAGAPTAAPAASVSPPAASTQAAASQPTGGTGGAGVGAQAGTAAGQPGSGSSNPPSQAGVQQAIATANATGNPADIAEAHRLIAEYQRREAEYQRAMPFAHIGYRTWQEQQAAAQQRQQDAANKPWFPLPAFNRGLLEFIRRNDQGQLEALPGAPPDALSQYTQFSKAFSDAQIDFFTNPQKFLEEPIKRYAAEVAAQIVQQHLGGYQQQTTATQIANEVAGWAFNSGQLTPKGQVYVSLVREAEGYGITDPGKQHAYAMRVVNAQFGGPAAAAASAPQQNAAAQQTFLANAAAGAAAAGSATPPNSAPQPPQGGSLRERLRANFDRHGITDKDFAAKT